MGDEAYDLGLYPMGGGGEGEIMKRIALVLAALMAVVMLAGCEPSMTITAKNKPEAGEPDDGILSCRASMHVAGVVTPHNATTAVQLQRTVGGNWQDVTGFGSATAYSQQFITGAKATPRRTAVNQSTGTYTINYYPATEPVETPLHFRVRSNAGSATSPGFYLTKEFC